MQGCQQQNNGANPTSTIHFTILCPSALNLLPGRPLLNPSLESSERCILLGLLDAPFAPEEEVCLRKK